MGSWSFLVLEIPGFLVLVFQMDQELQMKFLNEICILGKVAKIESVLGLAEVSYLSFQGSMSD